MWKSSRFGECNISCYYIVIVYPKGFAFNKIASIDYTFHSIRLTFEKCIKSRTFQTLTEEKNVYLILVSIKRNVFVLLYIHQRFYFIW